MDKEKVERKTDLITFIDESKMEQIDYIVSLTLQWYGKIVHIPGIVPPRSNSAGGWGEDKMVPNVKYLNPN